MPSVQEELEALRKQSLAKTHGAKLADASGLSTPEQEKNAILSEKERTRIGNYQKDAAANLQSYNEAKVKVKTGTTAPTKDNSNNKNKTNEKMAAEDPKTAPEEDDDDIPQLEEVDDDEGVPMLEEVDDSAAAAGGEAAERTLNRAERKARRMMEKLGMKKVPGITQVTLKMGGRQGVFTIPQPDVFEKNGSYIVFGEARQGGQGPGGVSAAQQQAQAVQQLAQQMGQAGGAAGGMEVPKIEELPDTDADGAEDVTPVDETGVDAKDIELVVSQAGCSRSKAVAALRENDNDLVNAIMSLTS
mmetsp:Transcript_31107/g.75181  ORF Transcript_31107/g.75181 Transcript_31107/m.75181 type:complete len:302 (+) Transcript_31107:195-1100(+)